MSDEQRGWKVLQTVLLEKVIGRQKRRDGSEEVVRRGFIAVPGQVIRDVELEPGFVERYDAGDVATRALVVDLDDLEQLPARESEGGGGDAIDRLTGDDLERRASDLEIEGRSSMSASQKREAIREAERTRS